MSDRNDASFKRYKRDTMRIAKQLFYLDSTISAIKNAQSESEITRIMYNARQRGEKR